MLGARPESEQALEQALSLSPHSIHILVNGNHASLNFGEIEQARDKVEAMMAVNPYPAHRVGVRPLNRMAVRDGRVDEALARLLQYMPELGRHPIIRSYGAVDYAWLLQIAGETQKAGTVLEQILDVLQTETRLGIAGFAVADVQTYVLQGRNPEALKALREAVDEGWRRSWPFWLRYDPILESLHDEPEYQAIIAELEADMAAQLQRIREMQANGELESIPG
jgi:tetratricopeptide (TPR) repeat protein